MTHTQIHMHLLEILAATTGLLNVYLLARNNMWNWLFGIIAVILYIAIFFQVKLYADMCLQLVFIVLQAYGIYQWLYGGVKKSRLKISNTPQNVYYMIFMMSIFLFGSITFILVRHTDSTTIYLDSITTSLSLVAQFMMCRKWIQHWWLWMIVNFISIGMYFGKDLYFTTGLYVILFFFCFYGYITWKRELDAAAHEKLPADMVHSL